jgi:hypothetical protein
MGAGRDPSAIPVEVRAQLGIDSDMVGWPVYINNGYVPNDNNE